MKPIKTLLVYAAGSSNATLSYQQAWPRQFLRSKVFECTRVNLLDRTRRARLRRYARVRMWRGAVLVLLHSVFSNARLLQGALFDAIQRLDCPKVFFIGNEYKLMPEKMRFCEDLGVSLFVSQSSDPRVHSLYQERLGCTVIGLPNTGLDPAVFEPVIAPHDRSVDLGYRAADAPWYLGHQERREIADYFLSQASRLGVSVDISLNTQDRFCETEWAAFLNRCRGQLGTEAGADYFELTDATRLAVSRFMSERPDASFEDVRSRFFADRIAGPGMRILSGRNVEAAGTRTVQLLFRGRYGGYFQPDEHYIPLSKDFSDIDDAMRKYKDDAFRERVVKNAFDLARAKFTYPKLLDQFTTHLRAQL
ncbi:MAG: glycosyltransferase [Acidobacteriota bacterium]